MPAESSPAAAAASTLPGKGCHPCTWRRLPRGRLTGPLDLKGAKLFLQRLWGRSWQPARERCKPNSAGNVSRQPPRSPSARVWGHVSCHRQVVGVCSSPPRCSVKPGERCRSLRSHRQCQTAGRRDGPSLQEVPGSPRVLLEKSGKATNCCLPGIKIPRERLRCRLSQRCRGPPGINAHYDRPDLSRCQTLGQGYPGGLWSLVPWAARAGGAGAQSGSAEAGGQREQRLGAPTLPHSRTRLGMGIGTSRSTICQLQPPLC